MTTIRMEINSIKFSFEFQLILMCEMVKIIQMKIGCFLQLGIHNLFDVDCKYGAIEFSMEL